ncbi:MAG TPA: M20/M25/M40 family metallo-hydrolase [Dictyoglomaceae bacterium]|nr:M20/M25/M40 family metallo-hydrolase [Dictyoglomaceae bacterium]HOL39068.1 M20/M25/M40 family metallo-hydrolase [Dictyoglomaceae bacterium]HPP15756.1 M20/M25/M40 family metallo-hydrolase [Dictyoglomaceae bacterium]
MEINEILKTLSNLNGPSGYEEKVITYIKEVAEKIPNTEASIDKQGSLMVKKSGQGKKIALFAHADEIGFVITKKEFGNYYRIHTFGGIDPKVIISQRLKIHTKNGTSYGVIGMLEPHLQTEELKNKVLSFDDLFLDVVEGAENVNIGDLATFSSEAFDLGEKYITGKALDNRASCVALLYTLELLNQFIIKSEPYFVFSIREEDGMSSAANVAFNLKPDLAIVLDVTHGDIYRPSYPKIETGKGPVLTVGTMIDHKYFEILKDCAEKNSVPYQIEPAGSHSHTDTDEIQITREGIPTLLVSIPLRYMHTPYEVVNLQDIKETARLLTNFIAVGGE